MRTKTCNMCGNKLKRKTLLDINKLAVGFDVYYCEDITCPNFALLQIPSEEFIKENE